MGREMDKYVRSLVHQPLVFVVLILQVLHNIYVKVRTYARHTRLTDNSVAEVQGGAFVPLLHSLTLWKFINPYVNIFG